MVLTIHAILCETQETIQNAFKMAFVFHAVYIHIYMCFTITFSLTLNNKKKKIIHILSLHLEINQILLLERTSIHNSGY